MCSTKYCFSFYCLVFLNNDQIPDTVVDRKYSYEPLEKNLSNFMEQNLAERERAHKQDKEI